MFKFKFKFLTRNANANNPLENERFDDINDKNVFINHSVKILARNMNTNTTKPLEKELVNDKNDFLKNEFWQVVGSGGGGAP